MESLVPPIWDPHGYAFWLVVVSATVMGLERIRPWRKDQRVLREGFLQDLGWLAFNGHAAGVLVALATSHLLGWAAPGWERLEAIRLISAQPFWAQFLAFLVAKDFLEWIVHNLLHRVPWLWQFHKVHHSITELDWIGNFRFHWIEIVVHRSSTYVPLAVLGANGEVILAIAVVTTLIGHLNHSNLNVTWGPLRYLVNSPRMHVWHHDRDWPASRPKGANFGICLSVWDWLFGTAWWPSVEENPAQRPARLGFDGIEDFPRTWAGRLLLPGSTLPVRRLVGKLRLRASR